MKKFLGYIFSPLIIAGFFLVLIIFHPIQWMAYNWLGYKAHKCVVDFMDLLLYGTVYLGFNRVVFINKQNLPIGRPIIFVTNHQSLLDIPPMIYHLRKYHAKFVSKVELTKGIPSVSYNLNHGGGANIDRENPRQSLMELGKLGQRMKENNWSSVIFPEGTRAKDGIVKEFQPAGVVAMFRKCPNALIVPIAINNSWRLVQWGIYPLSTFEKITFEVLAPIEPSGRGMDEVVLEAENAIKKALGQA